MYDVAPGLSKALLGVYSLLFPANNVAGRMSFTLCHLSAEKAEAYEFTASKLYGELQARYSNFYRAFSLTWPASLQICWDKRELVRAKRIQLPRERFGTATWPLFHCFRTPIWPP